MYLLSFLNWACLSKCLRENEERCHGKDTTYLKRVNVIFQSIVMRSIHLTMLRLSKSLRKDKERSHCEDATYLDGVDDVV